MLKDFQKFHKSLFNWFKEYKRNLPWRSNRTPYRVWVSEIMLQQTRVSVVTQYFSRWMQRFPDLLSLSSANQEDVLLMWQGLGYYSRAKNIHKSAKILIDQFQGVFPQSIQKLQTLPGIGLYTASAIAVFALRQKYPLVEANIRRVLSRIFGIQDANSSAALQKDVWKICASILPQDIHLAALFNESLMELGALICIANTPKCYICPIQNFCFAKKNNLQKIIPLPLFKKKIQLVHRNILVIKKKNKKLWLQKRSESLSLLGGLWEFPHRDGNSEDFLDWQQLGNFTHHYTNNKVIVTVFQNSYSQCKTKFSFDSQGTWIDPQNMRDKPLHAGAVKVCQLLGIQLV